MSKKCEHILGIATFCGKTDLITAATRLDNRLPLPITWWKHCPLCGVRTARARRKVEGRILGLYGCEKLAEMLLVWPFADAIKPGKFPKNLGATTRPVSAPSAI